MRSLRRAGVALIAGVLLADLLWGALYIGRTSFVHDGQRVFCLWDDAMISMQYARNWAEGWGLVWSPGGARVWGITNPGVTAVMAGLHLLPLAPRHVSLGFQLLNLAGLGLLLLGMRSLALLATGDRAVAAGTLVGTALCAPLQLWSLQGADTGFVALWLVAALYQLARARGHWPRGLFAWLALGPLLRPDALLFGLAFWVGSLGFAGRRGRRLALGAVWLASPCVGLALFGWLYYGDPLPNTFYLKATGSPRALVLAAGLAEFGYWPFALPTAAPLALAGLRRFGRRGVLGLAALLVATALAYNVLVGGDWKGEYGSRFVAPVLPLLVLLAAAGARALLDLLPGFRSPAARSLAVVAAAASVALLASPRLALIDWFDLRAPPMLRAQNQANFALAVYLRDHTRPGATIGVHYGGVPPYFSERRAVDFLGKSDAHIAHLQVDRFIPGHSKWDWDYVLRERRPDLILAVSRGLGRHPDFRRDYVLVEVPGGLRFFLRRASLGVLTDPEVRLFEPATGRPLPARDVFDPRRRRARGSAAGRRSLRGPDAGTQGVAWPEVQE